MIPMYLKHFQPTKYLPTMHVGRSSSECVKGTIIVCMKAVGHLRFVNDFLEVEELGVRGYRT